MASWKLKLKGKTPLKAPIAVKIDNPDARQAGAAALDSGSANFPQGSDSPTQALEKEKVHVPRGKKQKGGFNANQS